MKLKTTIIALFLVLLAGFNSPRASAQCRHAYHHCYSYYGCGPHNCCYYYYPGWRSWRRACLANYYWYGCCYSSHHCCESHRHCQHHHSDCCGSGKSHNSEDRGNNDRKGGDSYDRDSRDRDNRDNRNDRD